MRTSQIRGWALGLILVGFADPVQGRGANKLGGPAAFTVHVCNYAHVDPKTLMEAKEVAVEIFRQAGVEMRWADVPLATLVDQYTDPDGQPVFGLSHIRLGVFPSLMADALRLPDNVMGVAPGIGPDRQMVYVFYDGVEALAVRQVLALSRGDIARPATRAQILGHMMAHELGHVLLNLPSHSATGIMRGDWDLKDLQDAAFGSLLFTRGQAATLRAEVRGREQQSSLNVTESQELAR